MKATYSFIVLAIAASLTACTSGNDNVENLIDGTTSEETVTHVSLSKVQSNYGAEITNYANVDSLPGVTLEKADNILAELKANNNTMKDNSVSNTQTASEKSKKVIMNAQYSATTRGTTENFALTVQMNFSDDNGTLYYWGADYKYSSTAFKWSANSMSFALAKNSDGATYAFESTGYLYFKISDANNTVVRVPVTFKGTHNFNTDKGTYCFQLVKGN